MMILFGIFPGVASGNCLIYHYNVNARNTIWIDNIDSEDNINNIDNIDSIDDKSRITNSKNICHLNT